MNPFNELRAGLCALAKRSVAVMGACANEESTKLYLALPMVGLLGYDYSNPYEVYPEHATDVGAKPSRIDLAIMRDGQPVVGLECKAVGADLREPRAELRAYYDAVPTVKLGIMTNGIVFEFFVDTVVPDAMDEEPFLVLDLETVARNGVSDELLETLIHLTKQSFNPETIAEMAHIHLCKKRLRTLLVAEANAPSEEFCRFVLQRAGLQNVRTDTIAEVIRLSGAQLWVIEVSSPQGGNWQNNARDQVLDYNTKMSGGWHQNIASPSGLEAMCKQMAEMMAAQYDITYGPGGGSAKSQIAVNVKRDGVKVLAPVWTDK